MKCTTSRKDALSKKAMEMQDKYTAMQKQQQQEVLSSTDLQNKKEVENPEQVKREINDFIETGNYKREPRIDLETLLPFDFLAPLADPDYDASKYEAERKAKRVAKLSWKPFAPATEEFSVSMPFPIDQSGGIYSTHSEAIVFLIIPSERPLAPITLTDKDFAVLATSALATAKVFDRIGRSDETAYEVSLIRRLSLNGQPGVQYRLKWTEYCGKTVSRILRVYAANKHIYALCVYPIPCEGNDEVWDGDEDDPRVSRFLRSFTIPAKSETQSGPQNGDTPVVLASNQKHPSNIMVDEGNVYWKNELSNTVMKISKHGGQSVTVISGLGPIFDMTADERNIYLWTGKQLLK